MLHKILILRSKLAFAKKAVNFTEKKEFDNFKLESFIGSLQKLHLFLNDLGVGGTP